MSSEPSRPSYQGRSLARLAAIQAVYQYEHSIRQGASESIQKIMNQFIGSGFRCLFDDDATEGGEVPSPTAIDGVLFQQLADGAVQRIEFVDGVIESHLGSGWTLQRIEPVSRSIFRVASADFILSPDVPSPVLIKEYVDLAACFLGNPELSFVGGMMNSLARSLRPHEFKG